MGSPFESVFAPESRLLVCGLVVVVGGGVERDAAGGGSLIGCGLLISQPITSAAAVAVMAANMIVGTVMCPAECVLSVRL
jgi:hypothetical protein